MPGNAVFNAHFSDYKKFKIKVRKGLTASSCFLEKCQKFGSVVWVGGKTLNEEKKRGGGGGRGRRWPNVKLNHNYTNCNLIDRM